MEERKGERMIVTICCGLCVCGHYRLFSSLSFLCLSFVLSDLLSAKKVSILLQDHEERRKKKERILKEHVNWIRVLEAFLFEETLWGKRKKERGERRRGEKERERKQERVRRKYYHYDTYISVERVQRLSIFSLFISFSFSLFPHLLSLSLSLFISFFSLSPSFSILLSWFLSFSHLSISHLTHISRGSLSLLHFFS